MTNHFYYVDEELSSDENEDGSNYDDVPTERQSIRKQLDFNDDDYVERRAMNNERQVMCRSKSDMFFVEP
jgi:hypothetical protein